MGGVPSLQRWCQTQPRTAIPGIGYLVSYVFSASGSTGVESCAVKFENDWPIGSSESWRPGTDVLASMMIYLTLILCIFGGVFYPSCLFKVGGGIVVMIR